MAELVTINAIARTFSVDPKTAHYWTTRPWFPEPVQRAQGRGFATLYDLDAVRVAKRRYERERTRKRAARAKKGAPPRL